jgi:hypothetical protein
MVRECIGIQMKHIGNLKLCKSLLIALITLAFAFPNTKCATYYIDAQTGQDTYTGLSSKTPWRTLKKVNNTLFKPGDKVLFKRGSLWRGQLIPTSGASTQYITYSAYGSDNRKPLLLGSVSRNSANDWVQVEKHLWQSSQPFLTDVGNLIFNDAQEIGAKKWMPSELKMQGDFWYNPKSRKVNIYSQRNPGDYYQSIECALRNNIIDQSNKHYIIYDNLALKYGAAHGIGGQNTHHIISRYLDISYIGGGDMQLDGSHTRFGNGIEFLGNAHDNIVEYCNIQQIYDAGLTNQNNQRPSQQYQLKFQHNLISHVGYACYEWIIRNPYSEVRDISFTNNTCLYAGYGWGTQRTNQGGVHIILDETPITPKRINLTGNRFYQGANGLLFIKNPKQWKSSIVSDYNCWHQPSGRAFILHNVATYNITDFKKYQALSGQDRHSIFMSNNFNQTASQACLKDISH